MEIVTVTLDAETARWARIEAARLEMSVSCLIRKVLQEDMRRNQTYEAAKRSFLSRPTHAVNESGTPYPSRDEIHDRAPFRATPADLA